MAFSQELIHQEQQDYPVKFNTDFTPFAINAIMNVSINNHIIQKGGASMEVEGMTKEELITVTIEEYTKLQRIKKANGTQENSELDYQIKVATAKLSSLGISVEDLTL